ncbi:hypothetical protein LZ31DRAFT_232035 [Colletotrichum somersetense]|nr:hypothetical protein LZ31DRAFT_232035 [Colletotrichum somersetense]
MDTDAWAKSLAGFLTSEWTLKKTPPKLDKLVENTIQSGADDPYRVFFIHGHFQGWLAYALNPWSSQVLRPSELQRIAGELSRIDVHHTVRQAILQMENKRRNDSIPTDARLNDRRTDHSSRYVIHDSTTVTQQQTGSRQPRFINASIAGIMLMFPQYMIDSTTKLFQDMQWYALVDMSFPADPLKDNCKMEINVQSNTVEYIASFLFGMQIETAALGREHILPSGARMFGDLNVTFGDMDAAQKLFGHQMCEAVNRTMTRMTEAGQGKRGTRCISMKIPRDVTMPAVIMLDLELEAATRIKNILYPENTPRPT